MRFRIWIEQQEDPLASSKNEKVAQLLDLIQKSTVGKQSLKDSLSTSFNEFKTGDNPGANVIRDAFVQNNVFKLMDAIGLDSGSVDNWLKGGPDATASATIGELLAKVFGTEIDKLDDVLNNKELPSEQEGETAEMPPEQAAQLPQAPPGADTAPGSPPMDPQTGMPMVPNAAPVPPQPGGPPANLPPAPMGAGTGLF